MTLVYVELSRYSDPSPMSHIAVEVLIRRYSSEVIFYCWLSNALESTIPRYPMRGRFEVSDAEMWGVNASNIGSCSALLGTVSDGGWLTSYASYMYTLVQRRLKLYATEMRVHDS